MKKTAMTLAIVWLTASVAVAAEAVAAEAVAEEAVPAKTVPAETGVTEGFEKGYTDGEPLRVHADWFFEDTYDAPTCEDDAGLGGGSGIAKGARAFTWVAKPFEPGDANLLSVTFGGDWQTDAEGLLDDDRAGWSISNEDDSSDNIFGVQMDPGGDGESGRNIEAYWDGDSFGDNGGRTSIVNLPKLKAATWYRLRAKFTKLSATSVKIDVTFVELDEAGKPTGTVTKGSIADTSGLPNTQGNEIPNRAYFTAKTVWPVYKNFGNIDGNFDNAYFEIEKKPEASSGDAAPDAPAESKDAAKE